MSLTNEDLLSISQLLEAKLEPVKKDITDIKLVQKNDILPRMQNIESCYITTYKRYQAGISQLDAIQMDVDILKKVVSEHSRKLQKIS